MYHVKILTLSVSATVAGIYSLAVLFESEHIRRSPMRFLVKPSDPWIPAFTSVFPYTTDCNPASGCSQLQFIATAGKEASFQVQSRDFWGNRRTDPETVNLLLMATPIVNNSEANSRVNGTFSSFEAGIGKASFLITWSGQYRIFVFSKATLSQNIHGSPFLYNTRPAAISAANCFITDVRDFKAAAGAPLRFSIQV
jgi:hypothetical protein